VTGKTDAVDALLRAGAHPDVQDEEGTPVIFNALKLDDPRMFHLLLDHGADLTGHDGREYTLLMAAAWHRHWPEATLLLDRGSTPAVNVLGVSVKSILDEGYVDDATLADPGYRALISRLGERGVRVQRTAVKAG
jgi:ankyrin repeat protein